MNEEEMAFISENYPELMEKFNLEISKLQERALKRSPHTKEYRVALELEILQAKRALTQSETESITSEINEDKK